MYFTCYYWASHSKNNFHDCWWRVSSVSSVVSAAALVVSCDVQPGSTPVVVAGGVLAADGGGSGSGSGSGAAVEWAAAAVVTRAEHGVVTAFEVAADTAALVTPSCCCCCCDSSDLQPINPITVILPLRRSCDR